MNHCESEPVAVLLSTVSLRLSLGFHTAGSQNRNKASKVLYRDVLSLCVTKKANKSIIDFNMTLVTPYCSSVGAGAVGEIEGCACMCVRCVCVCANVYFNGFCGKHPN